MDTLTITVTDTVTGTVILGLAPFQVDKVSVDNPGDQTGKVGQTI